jgi:hypothetical protein
MSCEKERQLLARGSKLEARSCHLLLPIVAVLRIGAVVDQDLLSIIFHFKK